MSILSTMIFFYIKLCDAKKRLNLHGMLLSSDELDSLEANLDQNSNGMVQTCFILYDETFLFGNIFVQVLSFINFLHMSTHYFQYYFKRNKNISLVLPLCN